jgi:hypothetical protein
MIVDRKELLELAKEKRKELERLGSTVFPIAGNTLFETGKISIKEKLKLLKRLIRAIEDGREKIDV